MREEPRNLQAEPSYPGIQTVCFSIRFPEWTIHLSTKRCLKDYPHLISECDEWQENKS